MDSVKNMIILQHGVRGQTAPSLSINQYLLYRHLLALINRLALFLIITILAHVGGSLHLDLEEYSRCLGCTCTKD